jgi:hyperosmotically inducible periplasmic protein
MKPSAARTWGLGLLAVLSAAALVATAGCAVTRGQSSMGDYIDDVAITTAVKSRFIEASQVDASAISVETLHGEVQLTGFARNANERAEAERLARAVRGVKTVSNRIAVRP